MIGPAAESKNPVVVCAADENYALPLAVTIRSALENLAVDRSLRLFVLDAGLEPATRTRLLESWPKNRVRVEWLTPSDNELADLPISNHVSIATYYRMLIPRLLPADLEQAIYLDSDLLVLHDLSELWDEPFSDSHLLAVPDVACPFFDCQIALFNYSACAPYLVTARPIPNYQSLGYSGGEPYFNGGVLVWNLTKCRQDKMTEKLFNVLETHRDDLLFWDQYALNVAFVNKWRPLPHRWNQGAHLLNFPSADSSSLSAADHIATTTDPAIVHFTSALKPWHAGSRHPHVDKFFEILDQTEWRGWRPKGDWGKRAAQQKLNLLLSIQRAGRRLSLATGWRWIGDVVGM